MRKMLFAALTLLSLGTAAANAAAPQNQQNHSPAQQGNAYNFMEGGGG